MSSVGSVSRQAQSRVFISIKRGKRLSYIDRESACRRYGRRRGVALRKSGLQLACTGYGVFLETRRALSNAAPHDGVQAVQRISIRPTHRNCSHKTRAPSHHPRSRPVCCSLLHRPLPALVWLPRSACETWLAAVGGRPRALTGARAAPPVPSGARRRRLVRRRRIGRPLVGKVMRLAEYTTAAREPLNCGTFD